MATIRDNLRTMLSRLAGKAAVSLPLASNATAPAMLDQARQAGLAERVVLGALADAAGLEVLANLPERSVSAEFVEKVPIGFARRHTLVGLASDNGHLPVVVKDLDCLAQLEVLSRYLGKPVQPVLAPPTDITAAINRAYQQRIGQAQSFIQKLDAQEVLDELRQHQGGEDLLDVAARAPVIKLVNLILFEATQARASDVHVQPSEEALAVRLRIDGVLYDSFTLPKAVQEEVVSRLKVMGRMNIAEKRLAQDGRATVQVGDRIIDLRLATLPTSYGERVVIRLLDKSIRLFSLSEVGMDERTQEQFVRLIAMEHGLILVTGPTGSGKTTTLYAAIQRLNATECNILTLEDPIEYGLAGISQTQVSEKKGLTFAAGLRSVLRQDPDVIMVGEIRDRETAVMAIQSALTGHLVFSTLHTNDAASAIARLLDLGIEPYLLASSVVGVLAQRLVRRVCPQCAERIPVTDQDLGQLGLERGAAQLDWVSQARGCPVCRQTGYSGRIGLFELLLVDEPIRRKIQALATASEIRAIAAERGMRSLREDGLAKARAGVTTVGEVARVTLREER